MSEEDHIEKLQSQAVSLARMEEKLDEVLRRQDKFDGRFEQLALVSAVKVDVEKEFDRRDRIIEDYEKRIKTLEMWRWGLAIASGAGATGGIGAAVKGLIGL